jgi:hypothetical protein
VMSTECHKQSRRRRRAQPHGAGLPPGCLGDRFP